MASSASRWLVVWSIAATTGFLLWGAPTGRRSGQTELLLGLTKSAWGDVHFSVSVAAIGVTAVHLAVDWKSLRACVRHLTHAGAGQPACQGS